MSMRSQRGEPDAGDIEPLALASALGMGQGPESEAPTDGANEDFLFHLYRGSELLQDNRVHEAKEELERALHLQPRDAKGQDLLAVVYFRLGLYPRAITIYEQLRRKNPRDTALLLNLALCYLKTGQAALARRDLEALLALNPNHTRAWGYLGLACDRLGDLAEAEKAFTHGGHAQMARRVAQRLSGSSIAPAPPEGIPSREVRDVVAAAFEELDAGELSFGLAEGTTDSNEEPSEWRQVELGQRHSQDAPRTRVPTNKPPTMDGPPPPPIPHLGGPPHEERRPTLIVGVPPAAPDADLAVLSAVPSPRSPAFAVDDSGAPSLRRAVVVPAVRVPPPSQKPPAHDEGNGAKRTLPPPMLRVPTPPPPAVTSPPPAVVPIGPMPSIAFPTTTRAAMHSSGVALVQTTPPGFAARLEAVRVLANGLSTKVLERQLKGKSTGESFGGVGSPVVHVSGEGQLILGPRPGRKIAPLLLQDEMCFVREDVLLGWDFELTYENGRLATGEGESVAIVQLRGTGAVLLEAIGDVLPLEVQGGRGLTVRREVVLGWFGRLVPRALAPNEAPCGQRGLVSFGGEGRIFVTGG